MILSVGLMVVGIIGFGSATLYLILYAYTICVEQKGSGSKTVPPPAIGKKVLETKDTDTGDSGYSNHSGDDGDSHREFDSLQLNVQNLDVDLNVDKNFGKNQ